MAPRVITPPEAARMVRRYLDGATVTELSRAFRVNPIQVRETLLAAGVVLRKIGARRILKLPSPD